MEVGFSEEGVADWISEFLRLPHKIHEDSFLFTKRDGAPALQTTGLHLEGILDALRLKTIGNETSIYDVKSYECLVRDEARIGLPITRNGNAIVKTDDETGLSYTLSAPTDEYLVFLLARVNALHSFEALRSPMIHGRLMRLADRDDPTEDVFDALRVVIPRLLTVRVTSTKSKTYAEMLQHSNAFLFQLTYNLNHPLVESRYFEDLLHTGRILRIRRSRVDDIEAPKRVYIPTLTYHYQMGVSTDSPSHEYLSYYHVLEHFFEQVYNDDLIERVRDRITQPGFSYRRRKDLQDLIRDVRKRLKDRDESVVVNEQEALRLTVEKYVRLDELASTVHSYDPTLLDYYRDNEVPFSDGSRVDLNNIVPEKTTTELTKRIYKTRNAIVHSKESEKSKYIPFEHDKSLIKEIPLLRFLAETIIIETSTVNT